MFGSDRPPKVDGSYQIETVGGGATYSYSLDLSETGEGVDGSGTLVIEDQGSQRAQSYDLDVSGSHDHPSVALEIVAETGETARFDGEFDEAADRASGTLTFPQGGQQDVTMRRP